MVLTWQHIVATIFITSMVFSVVKEKVDASPNEWRVVEALAENYPYIVALLNRTRSYVCTGTIIDKRTILTSGSCVAADPRYVTVGAAVYGKKINVNNIFKVAYTKLHGDYVYDMKSTDPNGTRVHSNIGLVFVARPVLEIYIEAADVGNYYATELKKKKLSAVGYGKINNSNVVVLQAQSYHQAPCTNPRWYYCVCGIEYSAYVRTYEQEFGQGAPVFLDTKVVGVTATPCGKLTLRTYDNYNIFTVIGPYATWIKKMQYNRTFASRARSNASINKSFLEYIYMWLLIIKILH